MQQMVGMFRGGSQRMRTTYTSRITIVGRRKTNSSHAATLISTGSHALQCRLSRTNLVCFRVDRSPQPFIEPVRLLLAPEQPSTRYRRYCVLYALAQPLLLSKAYKFNSFQHNWLKASSMSGRSKWKTNQEATRRKSINVEKDKCLRDKRVTKWQKFFIDRGWEGIEN